MVEEYREEDFQEYHPSDKSDPSECLICGDFYVAVPGDAAEETRYSPEINCEFHRSCLQDVLNTLIAGKEIADHICYDSVIDLATVYEPGLMEALSEVIAKEMAQENDNIG